MSANKVILVTGSNTGIGYELVHLLAAKGHTVYLASRKEVAGIEAAAKIKKEKSLDVKFVQLDITDLASVQAAAAKIEKDEGRLDVLVNNAGISEMDKGLGALAPNLASIRAAFETNFFGLVQTTTAFLPLLQATAKPASPAVILNISTDMASNTFMAGPNGFLHGAVAYNSSKAAANSYTIALAHELKDAHVKVNAQTPGFTTTKLNGFAPGGKTAEQGAQTMVEWCLLDKDGKTGHFASPNGEFPW
ncbi:oxidoreductase [Mycena rosella]|uniref:Oxidoreductase n=1 Tax=Mycena rosella TaxID=1033263 RepID=A0AAD7DJS7_MYCRO|nr:oxidoreductase [Mycena rosella]